MCLLYLCESNLKIWLQVVVQSQNMPEHYCSGAILSWIHNSWNVICYKSALWHTNYCAYLLICALGFCSHFMWLYHFACLVCMQLCHEFRHKPRFEVWEDVGIHVQDIQDPLGQDTISCTSNDDCIPLNPSVAKVECFRGICILDTKTNPTCYSHADCSNSKRLCSGDGYCTHSRENVN